MVLKNIKVDEDVWYKLAKMKLDLKLRRIADVVKKLVEDDENAS